MYRYTLRLIKMHCINSLHDCTLLLFAQQFVEEGGVDGCPQGAIKHLLNLTNSLNLCLLPLGWVRISPELMMIGNVIYV